jgi:hypothetical protein
MKIKPSQRIASRQIHLESLEPRHALTGLSAALDHGVLRIDSGSGPSVAITLSATSRKVKLAETNQSFALDQVKSIDIQLHGQRDVVTLNNALVSSNYISWIPLAAHSDGGDEQLVQPSGKPIYFGDDAQELTIDKHGSVKLGGNKPDWFAKNIPDNDLGSELRHAAVDNVLSRQDMLDALDIVEQRSTVGAEDFKILQTIVAQTSLFKNVQYVNSLANLVVNPSVANTLYQGNPLGSLSKTSTGAHLTLLVDKWFLGTDHPGTQDVHDPLTWRVVEGTLFSGPPEMHQIHQGDDGDCFFLSGMEALAIHNPQVIVNMFIDNGDGTYTVRFFHGKHPVYVTIDSELPIFNSDGKFVYDDSDLSYNNPSNVLWSAFAEKAYAQLAELGWSRPGQTLNSYMSINDGDPISVYEQITGNPAHDDSVTKVSGSKIAHDFLAGKPVSFNSPEHPHDPQIVPFHIYAMVGYNQQNGKFELFNPWGFHNGSQFPALLWLTWDEIVAHYNYAHVGSAV